MLSEAQVDQYHRDGYVMFKAFFGLAEIAPWWAEIERASAGATLASHDKTRVEMEPNQPPDGTLLRRIYEPCTHYPPFRDLSESNKLLVCVEQLLGSDLEFHLQQDQYETAGDRLGGGMASGLGILSAHELRFGFDLDLPR